MSILSELGIDPESLSWEDLASCKNFPKEFITAENDHFFDKYENDEETAKQIDQLCFGCPVIKQCYEQGVKEDAWGVRGGVYLTEGEIDGKINRHKTDEDWNVWTYLTEQ